MSLARLEVETSDSIPHPKRTLRPRYWQAPVAAVPWCADCAKRHNGLCEAVDAARDNSPSVNVNLRGVADDGALGTGFDANGLRESTGIVEVTDGSNVRLKNKSRVEAVGISDTTCGIARRDADGNFCRDADGNILFDVTAVIPRRKDRRDAKRTTKRTLAAAEAAQGLAERLASDGKLSVTRIDLADAAKLFGS